MTGRYGDKGMRGQGDKVVNLDDSWFVIGYLKHAFPQ